MTDFVIIPAPHGQWLRLSIEQYTQAVLDAAQSMPESHQRAEGDDQSDPELLTAEQMSARTGVEASWFLTKARVNDIPHVKLGKYVRFSWRRTLAFLGQAPDPRFAQPVAGQNGMPGQELRRTASEPVTDLAQPKRGRHGR